MSEDEWSEWIIAGLRHLDLNQELVLKQTTFEGFLVILANPHINHKHIDRNTLMAKNISEKTTQIHTLVSSDYNIFLNIQIIYYYSIQKFQFGKIKKKVYAYAHKACRFVTFLIIINFENSCAVYFYYILFLEETFI